jgi:hypothetical protein
MEKRTVDDINAGAPTPIPASPAIPPAVAIDGGFRDCLPSALSWAARGFTVFRLGEGRKDAKGIYFLETGLTNPGEIARSFQPGTRSNIGWRTGRTFGGHWVAIDLDVKDGRKGPQTMLEAAWIGGMGAVSVEQLAAATGAVLVRTPSGGFHLIYDGGSEPDYSQSTALWAEEFGADCGVDVRARHGYCVAPGSWTKKQDGAIAYYEVVAEPAGAIGALPEWIRDRLLTHAERSRGALEVSGHNGSALLRLNGVLVSGKGQGEWSEATIEDAKRWVLDPRTKASKGGRDNMGYVVGAYLRRSMAFSKPLALELMGIWSEVNCTPSMSEGELSGLLDHAERYARDLLGVSNFDVLQAAIGAVEGIQEVRGRRAFERRPEDVMTYAGLWAMRDNGESQFKAQLEWFEKYVKKGGIERIGMHSIPMEAPDFKSKPAEPNPAFGLLTENASVEDEENVRWLIPNAIAVGKLNILLGDGGKGKSQLTLAIAAAVTHGLPLGAAIGQGECLKDGPFATAPERGRVLVIADEDDWRDTIKPRIHAAGAARAAVDKLKASFRYEGGKWIVAPFALDKDAAALRTWLKHRPDTKLIIVDPLNAYFGEKADSYKAADVRNVLRHFTPIAAEFGAAILAIMHPTKKNEGNVVNWISGSAAVGQVARSVWALLDDPEDANWQEEGRQSPRLCWVWAKGNTGKSAPTGMRLEIQGYSYMRSDFKMCIESSRAVPLGLCNKTADKIAKELREGDAKKHDGRLSENRGGQRAFAEQIITDHLLSRVDFGGEDLWEVTQQKVEAEGPCRATAYNAKTKMIKEGKLVAYDIVVEGSSKRAAMVRLAEMPQNGLPPRG